MKLFGDNSGRKLDFIIIGAQKGGTTALDAYLRKHPDVGMGNGKEIHFFDDEEIFSKRRVDYSVYDKKLNFSKNKKIYGEATPIYLYWEGSCRRIWEYNKDIKLIAVLRNPADRAYSHWNMERDRNNETEDFMYCIQNESQRTKEALPLQHRIYSYLDRGFYAGQIRRYQRFFPREQLLFIKYENFRRHQEEDLETVFRFLDIKATDFTFQEKEIHARPYRKKMSPEQRSYLISIFQNDIREVERLLQWDCGDWLQS